MNNYAEPFGRKSVSGEVVPLTYRKYQFVIDQKPNHNGTSIIYPAPPRGFSAASVLTFGHHHYTTSKRNAATVKLAIFRPTAKKKKQKKTNSFPFPSQQHVQLHKKKKHEEGNKKKPDKNANYYVDLRRTTITIIK